MTRAVTRRGLLQGALVGGAATVLTACTSSGTTRTAPRSTATSGSPLVTCDVFRIEAADAYSDDYDAAVARNVREQDADARPEIAGTLPSLAGYDTVLVGSPIRNVRPPQIMATFVEGVDLAGKRPLPFVTYAVSGLGSTQRVYEELAPDAAVLDGLAVRGEQVAEGQDDVEGWLRDAGLLT